jgi:hypothetical protein
MRSPRGTRRHRPDGPVTAFVVVALLLLGACATDVGAIPDQESGIAPPPMPVGPEGAQTYAAGIQTGDGADSDGAGSSQAPREVPWTPGHWELPTEGAQPVGLWVPRIDVTAPMRGLGLYRDGTLEVPEEWDVAGWYTGGPRPGSYGPAVIAGHVDSRTGPAVFHRLGELRRGDLVHVAYDDGFVSTFVVVGSERVDKDAFPTARVYGDTQEPELRLITCGGQFDRSARSYGENVIVYATIYATWWSDDAG